MRVGRSALNEEASAIVVDPCIPLPYKLTDNRLPCWGQEIPSRTVFRPRLVMKGHFQVPFFYWPLTRIATTPSIVSLRNQDFDSSVDFFPLFPLPLSTIAWP